MSQVMSDWLASLQFLNYQDFHIFLALSDQKKNFANHEK